MNFANDIKECLHVLQKGGLILYPTDTIWGIGCDAANEQAVSRVFKLKQRKETKSMIILLADKNDVAKYVENPDDEILNYIFNASRPTTAIYEIGKNVASNLINEDGSIAIRIVKDEFCSELIKNFNKPIVATSANFSGNAAPSIFKDINIEIKNGVDYIAQHRQGDFKVAKPSVIIKLNEERKIEVIRS